MKHVHEHVLYTKQMLAERFDIHLNTVRRTLKACGLPTARTVYTSHEIETYFIPARRLFQAQLTARQVAYYFTLKQAEHEI